MDSHVDDPLTAMVIYRRPPTVDLRSIETTSSDMTAVENNHTYQQLFIEPSPFSYNPSRAAASLQQWFSGSVYTDQEEIPIKQEDCHRYASAIKNEYDDSISVISSDVKQEETVGQISFSNNHTLRDDGPLFVQGKALSAFQAATTASSGPPVGRDISAPVTMTNWKIPRRLSSKKRKDPHDGHQVYDEDFWDEHARPGQLHHLQPGISTAPGDQTYQIRAPSKRQAIEVVIQHHKIAPELPGSSRGSSDRSMALVLNKNLLIIPDKESSFLRIVKGSNATHNLLPQAGAGKSDKLKASSKKQMFVKMLRASPKTSDAKRNILNIQALKDAVGQFGRKIRIVDDGWLINGMKSPLLDHQAIGVAWMHLQEKSESESKGGMLCDSMGLGKTVETIAAMVTNLPNKTERTKHQRATLIIAASTLLTQWEAEIEKHASDRPFGKVIIYQASKNLNLKLIASCDIVLASYGEVARSCPFPSPSEMATLKNKKNGLYGTAKTDDDDSNIVARWIEESMEFCEDLHRVDWYRIVIDEAHKMKSHNLRLSHAVNALKGKHRWILTGTPIMNRPEELYGYFRFLKEPDARTFKMFKAKFTNILKAKAGESSKIGFCYRQINDQIAKRWFIPSRTMQDEFLGRPLVDLPPPHHKDSFLEFSQEEGIIYRAMEAKYVKAMIEESHSKKEPCTKAQDPNQKGRNDVPSDKQTKNRKPELMIIGINRLRQMTAHPLLVERHIQQIFDIQELKVIHQKLLDLGRPQHLVTARIGVLLSQKEEGVTEYSDDEYDGQECSICFGLAVDEHIIRDCKHNFCKTCIEDYIEEQGEAELQCPMCDMPFEIKSLKRAAPSKKATRLSKPSNIQESRSKKASKRKAPRQPGEDSVGNLPPLVNLAWLKDFDLGRADMPPSTKLDALETSIRAHMATNPSDKQIIFTQWRAFAAVLGRALQRKKIRFVYLTGGMIPGRRSETVSKFSSDGTIKIMVATLKTAGEGLNLECANVVYSIDAWWHVCAERQAFCRVYRIGQKKETFFNRLILRNSVDERIIEMQDKKLAMVEQTLKPTSGDMAQLFGIVRTDRVRVNVGDENTDKDLDMYFSETEEEDESYGQMGDSDSNESSDGEF